MADNQLGTYYLANHKESYEVQRNNNFEFIVHDLGKLLRAGATGREANAYISNGADVLKFSAVSSFSPSYQLGVIEIKRGNNIMKAAGTPTFQAGQFVINDYIGADGKSVLLAWQALAYNVRTEKIGKMTDYKKDCSLIERTPDGEISKVWKIEGCWVSDVAPGDFNVENSDKKTVTATIQYDKAYLDYSQMPQ